MTARKIILKILSALMLALLFIAFIFPLYWMFTTSIKTSSEAMAFPPTLIPSSVHFENFVTAFQDGNFLHYGKNTIIITVITVLGQMVVCVPAAYAFGKLKFKFQKPFFGIILVDMMIPGQVTFIPLYMLFSRLGLIDTYTALTVPFMYSSMAIFFMRNAFKQVPDDLVDAAKIDGTSQAGIIFKVMLPIVKPVIITLALILFISKWNDYFWTLVLTNKETVRTLPFAITALQGDEDAIFRQHITMAGNFLMTAPLLVIYFVANKRIKEAFVYGGIK